VDAYPFPEQLAPCLADLADDAEGLLERGPGARSVLDPGQPVPALPLGAALGTQELDQVRTPGMLLAQLEAPAADAEVGVGLVQHAVVGCAEPEPEAHGQGQLRVRVSGLESRR